MNRLLVVLLILSIGCSPALLSPVEREDPEVEQMKSRILELQRQARVSEVELERLRRQVAERQAGLGSQDEARDATSGTPVLHDQVPGDRLLEEPPIEEADIPPPPPEPRAVRALGPPVAAPVVPGPLSPAAQELYDRGYTFYHRSQYVDAETAFQQFLGHYPGTELADNAHYWIGESRFARADYRAALSAFREILARYPDGNKVPDALLKAGDCLARLGEIDAARQTYEDVVNRFPKSAAAVTAEERRAGLR